jgi:hypothetical protein
VPELESAEPATVEVLQQQVPLELAQAAAVLAQLVVRELRMSRGHSKSTWTIWMHAMPPLAKWIRAARLRALQARAPEL